MTELVTVLVGLALLVGLVGVVVPVLPGILLQVVAVAVWALTRQQAAAWLVLGGVVAVALVSQLLKYAVPGRQLRRAGIPSRTLLVAGGAAVVGFFVIPVVGLLVGFVLGIYLSERRRLDDHATAWQSTRRALVAAGWSTAIEASAGLLIIVIWVVGVATT
ncbi:MAG: DUF456 domain-containing protein [Angustibacter sp.]